MQQFLNTINIIPITEVLDIAAKEYARLQLKGTPLHNYFDLLIGCTSIVHNMIMVTENTKDFKNLEGIKLENWIER